MTDFNVEVSALKSDAKVWDQAARDLAAPIAAVKPLVLDDDDLTAVGNELGLTATYEKARADVENLMTQATKYFEEIGSALIAVAGEYDQSEQTGTNRFRQQQSRLGQGK